MAAKKKQSKAIAKTDWKSQLAKFAKDGKKPKEKALTSTIISVKGNKFSLGKASLGRQIDCIIVGWNFENAHRAGDYVEGQAQPPNCFAIGYDEDTLTPHDSSPEKQSDNCENCLMNEWGSGKGDGKACTQRRRLILVVDADKGKPELKMLRIPPTSLANWKLFTSEIEDQGLEPMQCAVNIHFDEDSTAMAQPLIFEFQKEITNNKMLVELAGVLETAQKQLDTPIDVSKYEKAKKGSKKKKTKKKAKKKSKFS